MKIPQIDTEINNSEPGKRNAGYSMPSETPFGNFYLKQIKIIQRVDRANFLVRQAFDTHSAISNFHPADYNRVRDHFFIIEEAVFHIRKIADEMISLYSVLDLFEKNGIYCKSIDIDCVGRLFKKKNKNKFMTFPFDGHIEVLSLLNEISNAYKHSFVNTDISLHRPYEPVVYALSLKMNTLDNSESFYDVPLSFLIKQFDLFYRDISLWLNNHPHRLQASRLG